YRAGNVYNVSGVPGDPTTYYLALPEGGVWKTTDAGTVWKPIFDQEAVPAIGAVAVAPSRPATVYVGTGDNTSWSFTPGEGVFKSTDAGATWTKLGLAETAYIPVLLVDPRNPDLVLVAALGPRGGGGDAGRGVFRSSDGGQTWQHTLAIGSGVSDMAWDGADPSVVYAKVQGGVYKSSDEGASWAQMPAQGLPALRSATIAVASGTHGQRVYALGGGLPGGRAAGVYRSDDGGQNWALGTEKIGSAGGRIYVDPQQPDTVYLMGTSLYRSTDGAHSFAPLKGAPGGDDYRSLWIDPANPKRMLAGVDQGPSITVDGGATWTPWYNLPNGQFYDVFTDNQFPYWVYGAQQDSGTAGVRSRSDYGDIRTRDWYPVGGFEAGYIAVDPLNPRWIYTQGWYHVLRRFDRETGQVTVPFTPVPDARFTGMPPTVFSPTDPHRLYLAAQYVLASDDGGTTWTKLGGDLTVRPEAAAAGRGARPPAIQALAPSPVDGSVIWAGTSNGVIQLSRDGGKSWKNVSPAGLGPRAAVNHLDASHHQASTAYAAVEEGTAPLLLRTTDYGANWQTIISGLPANVRMRVIREDPKDADLLYAGTEMGAYVSFNRGDAWQPLQLNLPHTVVSDMKVHGDDLVISTYGRSFWILDDVTPLRQRAQAQAAGPYLYAPEEAMRVRWSNNHDTPLPPEVPAGENPPEGAILDYYLPAAATGPMSIQILDGHGQVVREYTDVAPPAPQSPPNVPAYWFGPAQTLNRAAGEHRLVWDLRYPTPKALTYSYYGNLLDYTEYTLTWHAVLGHTPQVQPVGPMAIPGTYTVQLRVDGKTLTRPLVLKNDPRSAVTQADLAAQYELEQTVETGLATSYDAYYAIAGLRQKLAATQASGAKALDAALTPLAAGTGTAGFGVANRDLARRLQDLEFGDFRPTASDVAAVEASCAQITAAAATLDHLQATDLAQINRSLEASGQAAIAPAKVSASHPCGG
ncbi:MAG TPA: hypothetical protein VN690_08150, partial [Terriglobales bacterium]|nr:hypothetical protein [Terriglobales bacterium]